MVSTFEIHLLVSVLIIAVNTLGLFWILGNYRHCDCPVTSKTGIMGFPAYAEENDKYFHNGNIWIYHDSVWELHDMGYGVDVEEART